MVIRWIFFHVNFSEHLQTFMNDKSTECVMVRTMQPGSARHVWMHHNWLISMDFAYTQTCLLNIFGLQDDSQYTIVHSVHGHHLLVV